jgi:predicted Zn-dependent protease
MKLRLATLLFCAAGLGACANVADPLAVDSGQRRIETLTRSYVPSSQALGNERDLGNQRVQGYGLARIPEYEAYASRVLVRLKRFSGVENVPGDVYVLATADLRAVSTADGNIFVSLGWIEAIESEDELAALLAHELAHVLLNHHDSNQISNVPRQIEFALGAALQIKRDFDAKQGKAADPRDTKVRSQLGSTVEMIDVVVAPAWTRSQEDDADRLGFDLAYGVGYSSAGFVELLAAISGWEEALAKVRLDDANAAPREAARPNESWRNFADRLLGEALTAAKDAVSVRHYPAAERQKALSLYQDRLYPSLERRAKNDEPYLAVIESASVTQVRESYRKALLAEALIQEGRSAEALHLLAPIVQAQPSFARQALPSAQMFALAGGMNQRDAASYVKRTAESPEPSWKAFRIVAQHYAQRRDLKSLENVLFLAQQRFHDAPALLPEKIALYRIAGQRDEATRLLASCELEHPGYREVCRLRAKDTR